jgi:hypothetical protein
MSYMTKLRMALKPRELWSLVDARTIERHLRKNLTGFAHRKFGVRVRLSEVFDRRRNKRGVMSIFI